MSDLQGSDSGSGTRLAHGLMQRFSSLCRTHANYVARSRSGGGEKRVFVADCARRLAAAAIDAEVERHELFLSQGNARGL
jgi:hypothetical protein